MNACHSNATETRTILAFCPPFTKVISGVNHIKQ